MQAFDMYGASSDGISQQIIERTGRKGRPVARGVFMTEDEEDGVLWTISVSDGSDDTSSIIIALSRLIVAAGRGGEEEYEVTFVVGVYYGFFDAPVGEGRGGYLKG